MDEFSESVPPNAIFAFKFSKIKFFSIIALDDSTIKIPYST